MVIATLGDASESPGEPLTYEGGTYRVGPDVLTLARIRELDGAGLLQWVDDKARMTHLGIAADGAAETGAEARERWSPSGEQLRIALYLVLGILAGVLIFVLAPDTTTVTNVPQKQGWTRVAAVSGSMSVTSDAFRLTGSGQRVNWSATLTAGAKAGSLKIEIAPVGGEGVHSTTVLVGGGYPGKGSDTAALPTGTYQMMVTASGCDWTASVWDNR